MTPQHHFTRWLVSAFSPALARTSRREAARAGFGALLGLVVLGFFVLGSAFDPQLGLYLIAPFGATAVLVFAVPNSPLAQPWSASVGNSVAADIEVAVHPVIVAGLGPGDGVIPDGRAALLVGQAGNFRLEIACGEPLLLSNGGRVRHADGVLANEHQAEQPNAKDNEQGTDDLRRQRLRLIE